MVEWHEGHPIHKNTSFH